MESGNFAGLILAMNAGRYDFLLAPVTARAKRAENMLFTEGYLFTAFEFGIKKGAAPLSSLDDLKAKVVVVNRGSAYDVWARDNAVKYGFTPLVLDTFTDATLAVVQGRAFAQLGGNTSIRYAAQKSPQFAADYTVAETRSHWSLAVRKGDAGSRDMLENAIECLKRTARRSSCRRSGSAPPRRRTMRNGSSSPATAFLASPATTRPRTTCTAIDAASP